MAQQNKSEDWSDYEPEVAHYFQHEPGARSANLEPRGGGSSDGPMPPLFPIGANYWTMMTAAERLAAADKIMPYLRPRNRIEMHLASDGHEYPVQQPADAGQPSCSGVLSAAYGNSARSYEDSAPDGARWLAMAKRAYMRAAQDIPARRRPTAMQRLMAKLDRIIGPE